MGTMEHMVSLPHLFMAALGAITLLGIFGLIMVLMRPAKSIPANLMELMGQQPARSRFSTVETLPEDAFIVLADISGYTAFMQGSRFAADHAQYLVLKLLEAIVDAAEPTLRFLKVEGDAVLFVQESSDPKLTGRAISECLGTMATAFQVEREALRSMNSCACRACTHVDSLDIKFVVDHGEISQFSVDQRPDVSGTPLIRAHRFLKAERGPGHLIVAGSALGYVTSPWDIPLDVRPYELEGLEAADAGFVAIPQHLEAFSDRSARSNPSLAGKLAYNLKLTLEQLGKPRKADAA